MEGLGGDAAAAGGAASPMTPLAKWKTEFSRLFQFYLDKSTPLLVHRWVGTLAVAAIYVLRVYYLQGFYVVSYGLGIYILNLLIGFLSPKVDPELEALDGASLPTKESDEFRPFIRRLPEFNYRSVRKISIPKTYANTAEGRHLQLVAHQFTEVEEAVD
ncbi:hypothetical protein M8C21_002565 [Ambrosia artemisiifolia]|uniref:Uncharacterized protein n=1 Tax=Ambrosia artemisiifolia TaxID=4212 RepID=A0AAD5G7D8_AMBAR|nr:hypothetical protein M8C21_002565 [Ambrosia artemisiifolia]